MLGKRIWLNTEFPVHMKTYKIKRQQKKKEKFPKQVVTQIED